jgi:hypothetical protein
MQVEMSSALAGAVVGAAVSGLISWLIAKRQIDAARSQQRNDRIWQLAVRLSQGAGRILGVHVADLVAGKPEEVDRLLAEWGPTARELLLLDKDHKFRTAIDGIGTYLHSLRQFAAGTVPRGFLEDQRSARKHEVENVIGASDI